MFDKLWRRAEIRSPRTTTARGPARSRQLGFKRLKDRALPSAAFVFEWNGLLVDVQRVRVQGNQQSARALAMMNAATMAPLSNSESAPAPDQPGGCMADVESGNLIPGGAFAMHAVDLTETDPTNMQIHVES